MLWFALKEPNLWFAIWLSTQLELSFNRVRRYVNKHTIFAVPGDWKKSNVQTNTHMLIYLFSVAIMIASLQILWKLLFMMSWVNELVY